MGEWWIKIRLVFCGSAQYKGVQGYGTRKQPMRQKRDGQKVSGMHREAEQVLEGQEVQAKHRKQAWKVRGSPVVEQWVDAVVECR